MNDRKLTKERAEALAAFIVTLRADWQTPGVIKALRDAKDDGDAFEHGIWAIRAAADPANRTPKIIAMEGRHRRPADPDEERSVTPDPTTRISDMSCKRCGRWIVRGEEANESHRCVPMLTPEQNAELAREARAQIQPPPRRVDIDDDEGAADEET